MSWRTGSPGRCKLYKTYMPFGGYGASAAAGSSGNGAWPGLSYQ